MNNAKVFNLKASIVGGLGVISGLVYFVLATTTKQFGTMNLIQILLLIFANLGLVLVGFVSKNTKETFLFPYGMAMASFLVNAYVYINDYVKITSYYGRWQKAPQLGFGIYFLILTVAMVIAYMCVIGKIQNAIVGIMSVTFAFGGFVFNSLINFPKVVFAYTNADELGSFAITLKNAVINVIQYVPYLFVFIGMLMVQLKVMKKDEE